MEILKYKTMKPFIRFRNCIKWGYNLSALISRCPYAHVLGELGLPHRYIRPGKESNLPHLSLILKKGNNGWFGHHKSKTRVEKYCTVASGAQTSESPGTSASADTYRSDLSLFFSVFPEGDFALPTLLRRKSHIRLLWMEWRCSACETGRSRRHPEW